MSKKAYLILADGSVFRGISFGAEGTAVGETVFATGMTGYEETLTDPSYYGQIVMQTFPLIGNYGVNTEDMESDRCCLKGYIVREHCDYPSNFRSEGDIDSFLKAHGVVGISGVDTRHLTRIIREYGVMNGCITTEDAEDAAVRDDLLKKIRSYSVQKAVESVTGKEERTYSAEDEKYRVVLYDFGYKANIRRELVKRGCTVTVVPAHTTAERIRQIAPDGIMLSNGPGDPAENTSVIEEIRKLASMDIPIFGICLGHQLMALAQGGRTEKMHYGHRGANQPVKDIALDRVFVTSQNHGYAVINGSISADVGEISHINVNDGSCEGIRYKNTPCFTVQFHPEACGGPHDTSYLFDEFIGMMRRDIKCR
ncbi:MAG: glutamine-hydrolyzing carbamoyl-phosphate synthase small subunit [Oscillospiraceae bacterium]|nr:glutamine-hydrolyzing carbamoyl-phosphate synthase small subunit [Oscillospiraceae bacterium]MBQ8978506.1 glutamine-hydrolyzing carbamoyl-phosphate synthase small subunit [Oscillospiraceae bacterium]